MTHDRSVIGVISDTHGLLRPEVLGLFAGVDLIVHAGDVGGATVLQQLSAIARVEAVSGNVDDRHDPSLTRERTIPVGELQLHLSHGDELGQPTAERMLARYPADIVIFGHSHRAVVLRGPDGRLACNPGSAGPRRFSLPVSVARLTVQGGRAEVEILTLDV